MLITDIHAHVLPGLDDGPKDMDSSVALLNSMQQTHTDRVFCTSHFRSPHFAVEIADMDQAFDHLSTHRSQHPSHQNTSVTLERGAEVRLAPSLADDIRDGHIPTLGNTRYVLVEFATAEITDLALSFLYELSNRHLIPIVAHPERNIAIQRDPSLIDTLRDSGVLMQGTAQCFVSEEGVSNHRSFKLAWNLLEQGKLDVIASDAHNTTTRPPGLMDAYDRIAAKFGDDVTETLIANANAIWDNGECQPVEVKTRTGRSGLRGLFARS